MALPDNVLSEGRKVGRKIAEKVKTYGVGE